MEEQHSQGHRLVDAYHRMLERAATALKAAKGAISLPHLFQSAKDTAVDLKELSRDEAERIAYYLRRDVEDAAGYARHTRKEFRDWLRFDIELIEDRVLGFLEPLVDHCRVELDRLAMEAEVAGWHTGEVVSPGTLFCDACGQEIHLHRISHIPPCPKCKATVFHRRRG